jgi:hypothetical protein
MSLGDTWPTWANWHNYQHFPSFRAVQRLRGAGWREA